MASLPGRVVLVMARAAALAWLLVLAPLELATALTGLVSRAVLPDTAGLALIVARVAVVAMGMVLGRQLMQRHPASRHLAIAWAIADLVTLALVLATSVLPSNRPPGDGPWVWLAYAAAAGTVLTVAAVRRPEAA